MQLTAPLFLFLFLPLSLALFFLTPQKQRAAVLTIISCAWLSLVNFSNPWGLLHIVLTVLVAAVLSRYVRKRRLLTSVGVLVLVFSLIASRLLTVFCTFYSYPTGLFFITLSAISLLLDKHRGDVNQKDSLPLALCYLLFFPTATLGPAVRYKHFLSLLRKSSPSTARFCDGIRLLMLGFIKRIAVAAVFFRALNIILGESAEMPFIAFPTALLLSFLLFYFFVSGSTDMARGISAMYGMRLPRDRANLLHATSPHTMFYALFFSVHCYLEDYLLLPIRSRLCGKVGKAVAAALSLVLFLLVFSPVPAAWLVALPLLCTALITALSPRTPTKAPLFLRVLYFLLSALSCSFLALFVAAGNPQRVLSLIHAVIDGEAARSYTFYFVVPDLQYILIAIIAFALLTLLVRLYKHYAKQLSDRTCFSISVLTTVLLFAGFLLTLLYFMPQFPQYALSPFGM